MNATTSFEQILKEKGILVYPNAGVSMMPLLRQGKDLMVIRARGSERLGRWDAVLFKRRNGQYVLHRILKIREKDYVICGDNCWRREYGITDEQILGVLTAVVRGGQKTIRVTDLRYRCYVWLWCGLYPFRAAVLWSLEKCKALFRHMIHKRNDD